MFEIRVGKHLQQRDQSGMCFFFFFLIFMALDVQLEISPVIEYWPLHHLVENISLTLAFPTRLEKHEGRDIMCYMHLFPIPPPGSLELVRDVIFHLFISFNIFN